MHHFAISSRGGKNEILGTNPVTVFGNDCKLWLNTASAENKSLFGAAASKIASLVSDDNFHYYFDSPAGNELSRNVGNKCWHITSSKFLRHSSTSTFKLLNDGSSWTLAFRYRPLYTSSTLINPIFMTNNLTTANTGFAVMYDNRSAQSATHALRVLVTKGSAGQSIQLVINNFFSTSDFTTAVISYDSVSGDLKAWKDGTLAGTQNKGAFTHNNANSSNIFTSFRYSGTATYGDAALIKHPIIISRTVDNSERATLEFIVEQGTETFGTGKPANFYFGWGQSNWDGDSGQSRSPAQGLRQLMTGVLMWTTTGRDNAQITSGQGFDYVKYKTNPNGTDPDFGPWLAVAERFNTANPGNTFMANYAVGATALQDGVSSPDWNVASGATECAQQSTNQIIFALDTIRYTFDRQPVVRGIMGREGETDGINPISTFKSSATALFKKWIDAIETAGYSTSLMRVVINYVYRTDYADPTRPYTVDVDADWTSMATNWATDNPSYASKIKGFHFVNTNDLALGADDTHFGNAEMREVGWRNFEALEPYMDEL